MSRPALYNATYHVEIAALRALYTYLPDIFTDDADWTGATLQPPWPSTPTEFGGTNDWIPLDGGYGIRVEASDDPGFRPPFIQVQSGVPSVAEEFEGRMNLWSVPITALYRYPLDMDEVKVSRQNMRHMSEAAALAMEHVLIKHLPKVAMDGDATDGWGIMEVNKDAVAVAGEADAGRAGPYDSGTADTLFCDAACRVQVLQMRSSAFTPSF